MKKKISLMCLLFFVLFTANSFSQTNDDLVFDTKYFNPSGWQFKKTTYADARVQWMISFRIAPEDFVGGWEYKQRDWRRNFAHGKK
jgi:hypothetical protein